MIAASPAGLVAAVGVLVALALAPFITLPMTVATVNFFVLLTGFSLRRARPSVHGLLMAIGIVSDLGLVLVLQLSRHAVQTALAFRLSMLNQLHIFFSTAATLLYLPMVVLGVQLLWGGRREKLGLHRALGLATIVFRALGFLLMFTMLKPAH